MRDVTDACVLQRCVVGEMWRREKTTPSFVPNQVFPKVFPEANPETKARLRCESLMLTVIVKTVLEYDWSMLDEVLQKVQNRELIWEWGEAKTDKKRFQP